MKNEIGNDFYCSANRAVIISGDIWCQGTGGLSSCMKVCNYYHRKHPTPKQYKEEYDEEYSNDWAVYVQCQNTDGAWSAMGYHERLRNGTCVDYDNKNCNACKDTPNRLVVCACTPFGKPDNDWRPE